MYTKNFLKLNFLIVVVLYIMLRLMGFTNGYTLLGVVTGFIVMNISRFAMLLNNNVSNKKIN